MLFLKLRNACLYILSYAGFFTSSEVINITSDIIFHDTHMSIKVEKSNTDQFRQGDEFVIAR